MKSSQDICRVIIYRRVAAVLAATACGLPRPMTTFLVLSLVLLGACRLGEAWVPTRHLRNARRSSPLRESSDNDWDRYYQDKHRATKVRGLVSVVYVLMRRAAVPNYRRPQHGKPGP